MENDVILGLIVVIILLIVQQSASSPKRIIHSIQSPHIQHQVCDDIYNDTAVPVEYEEKLLEVLHTAPEDIKRESLVSTLREIIKHGDTSDIFDKYPEIHKHIFSMH